ncbi:PD40 domain-containing protein [Pyxidicoccus parkwayensis]|uniref:PD40 domain-containing protein n=1 Tax=Pyxidicoccus parkwayensis TaxID=2813578 RepID=A0ABX7NR28_9BACT|nr:PD40 domain-containing protein [Pyxidicoccus parkwaysis]QSQ21326.1 PD40 domain-containing protein [Pyxidicoccus parkwaysis]
MLRRHLLWLTALLLTGCSTSSTQHAPASEAHAPEVYGAGLFTTGAWDFFMAFSPDQKRVLFCRADDAFEKYEIFETRLGDDGRWSTPVKPRFAKEWSNADPHISPDGRTVVFISNRPSPGETTARATHDIFVAHLQPDGEWSEATRLPAPVNDAGLDEWSPAVAANGNLYFGGERSGTRGGSDLWVSRLVGGVYQPPENLGYAINTAGEEVEPWIAPDESYLLFSALRRPESIGSYDVYLSRRLPDGGWEKARLLGNGINSTARDFNQSVSPDGKWLYFSSNRPHTGDVGPRFDFPRNDAALVGIGKGTGDIYRVPMSALGL